MRFRIHTDSNPDFNPTEVPETFEAQQQCREPAGMRPAGSFDAQGLFKQLAPWSALMLLSNDLAGIKLAVVESAVCKAPTHSHHVGGLTGAGFDTGYTLSNIPPNHLTPPTLPVTNLTSHSDSACT